ncbi:MAG TPA: ASPIC/UnbV domain-containing protein [bacterium]|nr:ASPIC/UnbV domain-containing protein [bacterium]
MIRQRATALVAIGVVLALYMIAQPSTVAPVDLDRLAAEFAFTSSPLPGVPGEIERSVRPVHPSLRHISAWISSVGAAVALADIAGTGLPADLCYVETRTNQVIVAPVPGTGPRYAPFVLDPAPLTYNATMAPMGCLAGDLAERGVTDLIVYYWGRTPIAFLRTEPCGGLRAQCFVPQELVNGGLRWYTNAALLADVDGDGHPDLVIGNYFPAGARILDPNAGGRETMQASMSRARNGGGLVLLLWEGEVRGPRPEVRFRAVRGALPDAAEHGWTLGLGAQDLRGSLLPDLYVANDFGPDILLDNRSTPGHPRFVPLYGRRGFATPSSFVLGRDSFKGMGVAFGDLTGSGHRDIVVSNITTPYGLEESNFAWVNTGDVAAMERGIAPFVNRAEAFGLARSGWGWDVKIADFNNAGRPNVLQATGFVKGDVDRWPELQQLAMGNDLLLHDPRMWPNFVPGDDLSGHEHLRFFVPAAGHFVDIATRIGLGTPRVSRGIAAADIFGDCRLDFAVASQWDRSYFYRNTSATVGRCLGLHLLVPVRRGAPATTQIFRGPRPGVAGRPALGATIEVILPNGRHFVADVDGGNGHSGKSSPDVHVGLGAISALTTFTTAIAWRDPDGMIRRETLRLTPGWYTVVLGWPQRR